MCDDVLYHREGTEDLVRLKYEYLLNFFLYVGCEARDDPGPH
jgi:hypothetical protein